MNRLALLIIILFVFSIIGSAFAQDSSEYLLQEKPIGQIEPQPTQYNIAIQLMNVRNVDRLNGTYDMTFWVIITSDKIDFTASPPPEFEFVDGIDLETSGMHVEPHLVKYKVIGTFQHGFDYHIYPFETLDLTINIEPLYPGTADKIVLIPSTPQSGQDTEANNDIPGWDLSPGLTENKIHKYPWGEFSRYTAHYEVSSPPGMTFLKKLLTIIVLNIIVFAAFWFNPKSLTDRAAVAVGAILASTYFHAQFLLAELPSVGYLTLADKIVFASYALYTYCIISVLIHNRLGAHHGDEYQEKHADRIDRKMRIIAPIVLVGTFLVLYPI